MLERINDLPHGVTGLKAVGQVSKADYEQVFETLIDVARREGRRIRFLYELGPEFQGFTAGAAWEDARLGLSAMRRFDGCAIVTDIEWIRGSTHLASFLLPCPVRVFGNQERQAAVEWLGSLSGNEGFSHRLLSDAGVIVVEVERALRARDFDDLALTADSWIEAHSDLRGLVVHSRDFPGWENFGGFVQHFRFVRDHQRKIGRIALATNAKVASLAPFFAEHFAKAEVKTFTYDEVDSAIAWAAAPASAP